MKHTLSLILLPVVLFLCAAECMAGKFGAADSLFRTVEGLSGDDMLAKADSLAASGNLEKALSLYMTISDWPEDSESGTVTGEMRVRACLGAGDVMNRRCDFAEALNFYVQGLIRSEAIPSRPYAASIYKNIGNVYSGLDDFETGNYYYKKGLETTDEFPDVDVRKRLLFNLIVNLTQMGKVAEAERCREMERQTGPDTDDLHIFHEPYLDGLILIARKDYRGAARKYRESVDFASRGNVEPRYVCAVWKELYAAYQAAGERDSAFLSLLECEKIIRRYGLSRMFPSVPNYLSEYYASAGDNARAAEYRAEYLNLRDSLSNEREFSTANNMLFQYRASKTASEIQGLYRQKKEAEEKLERHQKFLTTVLLVMIPVCGFLLLFYLQKRRIQRGYRSLYEINREYARTKEMMDERHRQDMLCIENCEAEISRLESAGDASSSASAEPPKYRTSNLDSTLRRELAASVEKYIAGNPAEVCSPDFSLERLAKAVGSNSKYVSQTINEEFGKNFNAFINDYRVKLACDRLSDPAYNSYTIKFVGESVGFKSQSAFTDAFRKITGLSPSVYKRMASADKG